MNSRRTTTFYLREGNLPADIARIRDLAISTIIQHIRHQLGEGELRPVEVILTFDGERGEELDNIYMGHRKHTYRTFEKHAALLGFNWEELRLYYDVRKSLSLRGDIYVFISDIELGLHEFIRNFLISCFGPSEEQWWRKGVPTSVRSACVQSRENDPEPVSDPYCYTTFIQLSEIIDANWKLFQTVFPEKIIKSRQQLLKVFRELNHLRNAVMHPVKRKTWQPAELQALKIFHDLLKSICSTPIPHGTPPGT